MPTEVGRDAQDAQDAPLYANLEASAYRPASNPVVKVKPAVPPKPGQKPLIYIDVVPNQDARKDIPSARQNVASTPRSEEQVIYTSVDPDRTAAFKERPALEEPAADKPPVIPDRRRSLSPQSQSQPQPQPSLAAVPDEAKRALERTVSRLIQDLARSRPAGPLKVFKSEDSYGARRAMREFEQALDGEGFKNQMLEHERLFPRTDDALPGARRAATEELAAMVAMVALQSLSGRHREALHRHVTTTGGVKALTAMLEKNHGKALATSTCKGMQIALQEFLAEGARTDA